MQKKNASKNTTAPIYEQSNYVKVLVPYGALQLIYHDRSKKHDYFVFKVANEQLDGYNVFVPSWAVDKDRNAEGFALSYKKDAEINVSKKGADTYAVSPEELGYPLSE